MIYDAVGIDERVDDILQVLLERADGEIDPELQNYNEYLIESMEMIRGYIDNIECKLREKNKKIKELQQ